MASENAAQSIADELKKLHELLDSGVISRGDFEQAKKKLLLTSQVSDDGPEADTPNDKGTGSELSGWRAAIVYLFVLGIFSLPFVAYRSEIYSLITGGQRALSAVSNATKCTSQGATVEADFRKCITGRWVAEGGALITDIRADGTMIRGVGTRLGNSSGELAGELAFSRGQSPSGDFLWLASARLEWLHCMYVLTTPNRLGEECAGGSERTVIMYARAEQ